MTKKVRKYMTHEAKKEAIVNDLLSQVELCWNEVRLPVHYTYEQFARFLGYKKANESLRSVIWTLVEEGVLVAIPVDYKGGVVSKRWKFRVNHHVLGQMELGI